MNINSLDLDADVLDQVYSQALMHTDGDLNELFKGMLVAYSIFRDQPPEDQRRVTEELAKRWDEFVAHGRLQ